MQDLLPFDEIVYNLIIGADEAGRGPLAGPVVASAVVLPNDFPVMILNDSKKLSEKKRLEIEKVIKEKAIAFSIGWATPSEIDNYNILQCSLLSMKRAYLQVKDILKEKNLCADILLVDGNKRPDVDIACDAIVKGDSKIPQIMAASILAKNFRDRYMQSIANKYPEYGFEKNKGYPCAFHKAALHEYGPCPIHRLTFKY